MMDKNISRKDFIKTATTAGIGLSVVPFNIIKIWNNQQIGADAHPTHILRYLLLDSRNISTKSNVRLVLGKPVKHPANPLMGQDRPWENKFDNFYGNIIYDESFQKFRLWYLNFIDGKNSLLYAESDNGLNWIKPNLGMVEYNGSTDNNIIMMMPHGAGIFKDTRESDPGKKYKMFSKHDEEEEWLQVAFSSDGIHWGNHIPQKQISATADTHNNALWAPTLNKYVAFTRQFSRWPYNKRVPSAAKSEFERKGVRQVARTESTDFLNWTRAEVVLEGLDEGHQTYAMPVFYYEGIYLGLVSILERGGSERVYTELAWSPDTIKWNRINPGTPFIQNSTKKGDFDYGMLWACAVPLSLDSDSISVYYAGFDLPHGANGRKGYLCLATIKKDRWAGYEAETDKGTIVTSPINCDGKFLKICADVKKGGIIQAEILNAMDFSLENSNSVMESVTNGFLTWSGKNLSPLINTQIQIRFLLKSATLYSFTFSND